MLKYSNLKTIIRIIICIHQSLEIHIPMKLLTAHLQDVNESYFQHFRTAMAFAIRMFFGALACAVHALAPFLFEQTGSAAISDLHERMVVKRREPKN